MYVLHAQSVHVVRFFVATRLNGSKTTYFTYILRAQTVNWINAKPSQPTVCDRYMVFLTITRRDNTTKPWPCSKPEHSNRIHNKQIKMHFQSNKTNTKIKEKKITKQSNNQAPRVLDSIQSKQMMQSHLELTVKKLCNNFWVGFSTTCFMCMSVFSLPIYCTICILFQKHQKNEGKKNIMLSYFSPFVCQFSPCHRTRKQLLKHSYSPWCMRCPHRGLFLPFHSFIFCVAQCFGKTLKIDIKKEEQDWCWDAVRCDAMQKMLHRRTNSKLQ